MEIMNLGEMSKRTRQLTRAALAMAFGLLLAACGGGVVPSTSVVATQQSRTLTPEWAEYISRKAVSYSPFRSGNRDTETITAEMVKQDMELLAMGDFRLIRLFDSSDKVSRLTLQVIRDNKLDIKVHLGAYVQSDRYASAADKPGIEADNQAELARCVALAKEFSSTVLAVSIGNETMVSWSFNPMDRNVMAGYITGVRNQIRQPVTTDDNWAFYAEAPKVIIDVIDFASMHTYSELDTVFAPGLWNWKQGDVPAESRAAAMMDASMAATKGDYQAVRANLDLKGQAAMPIVIGETGWNAVNLGVLAFRAHPVNQKMYLLALEAWAKEGKTGAGPAQVFYFEAFDEPWKGSDDKWGLFNVDRQARYAVQGLYPASLWEPGSYTAKDALHWVPLSSHKVIANRFTLYAEAYTLNEDRPTYTRWDAWENGTTATRLDISPVPTSDGITISEITPKPLQWGWGMQMGLVAADITTGTAADLSDFTAGFLNFSVQTTYPGMLKVGFVTGSGLDGTACDAYVPLVSGQYGYVNDGAWHAVSIPVSDLLAAACKPDPGLIAPPRVDLTQVSLPFVINDVYAQTGKPANANITSKVNVDAIFWSR